MQFTTRELYTRLGVMSYKPITEQDRVKAAKQAAADLASALVQTGKMQEYEIVSVGTGMATAGGPSVFVWSRMDPTVLRSQFPETLDGIPLEIRSMAKDYAHGIAGRTEATLVEQEYVGVMICLPVPPEVAAQIALDHEHAVEIDDLHVTLFFLGDLKDLDRNADEIEIGLRDIAKDTPPIVGKLGGIGRFDGAGENDPVYLNVDAPALEAFRDRVGEMLSKLGVEWSKDHGFTPHLTLTYVPREAELPKQRVDAVPVVFRQVGFWMGSRHLDLPLARVAESRFASRTRMIREFMFGSSWMGSGHSYPGPEPGSMFSLGVVYPGPPERVDGEPVKKEKPGREREGRNRWQRRLKR